VIRVLSWVALIGSALFACVFLADVVSSTPPPFGDWQTYVRTTDRFLAGEPLYSPQQLSGPYSLTEVTDAGYGYPPPSVLLFLPFRPGLLGITGWLALNVGLLVGGLGAIFRKELAVSWPTALALGVVSLTLFQPFANGVRNANVNVGLAGIVALLWSFDRSPIPPVIAGSMAMVKVFPAFFGLWVKPRELLASVAVTAIVALGIFAVTLPLVGLTAWRDFATAISNAHALCSADRPESLVCLLTETFGGQGARAIALATAIVLAALSVALRDQRVRFLLLTTASIVSFGDLHPHYLLIPFVAVCAAIASVIGPLMARLDAFRVRPEMTS
jgi:hypothetical protein